MKFLKRFFETYDYYVVQGGEHFAVKRITNSLWGQRVDFFVHNDKEEDCWEPREWKFFASRCWANHDGARDWALRVKAKYES